MQWCTQQPSRGKLVSSWDGRGIFEWGSEGRMLNISGGGELVGLSCGSCILSLSGIRTGSAFCGEDE